MKAASTVEKNIFITDKKTIKEVQDEFHKLFPFLKLEFFQLQHKHGEGSPKKFMIEPHHTIADCRTVHTSDIISIDAKMKVSTLEDQFKNKVGISVQVFRWSGNTWLETTVTDDWTLEQQNSHGQETISGL